MLGKDVMKLQDLIDTIDIFYGGRDEEEEN